MQDNLCETLVEFAKEIFAAMGTGHSERVYHNAFLAQLRCRGEPYDSEVMVPLHYKGSFVGFIRLDVVVRGRVVVEFKVWHDIRKTDVQQLEKYLRHTKYTKGLLLNFSGKLKHIEIG